MDTGWDMNDNPLICSYGSVVYDCVYVRTYVHTYSTRLVQGAGVLPVQRSTYHADGVAVRLPTVTCYNALIPVHLYVIPPVLSNLQM